MSNEVSPQTDEARTLSSFVLVLGLDDEDDEDDDEDDFRVRTNLESDLSELDLGIPFAQFGF